MLKKVFILISILIVCQSISAQVKSKIKKGRQNKSESQYTIASKYLQIEWEIGKEKINKDISTVVYPNLLLRYGVNKRLEINTEFSLLNVTDVSSGISQHTKGLEPILIGANYLLLQETQNSPAIILSGQLEIPFLASSNFKANYFAPLLQATLFQPIKKNSTFSLTTGFSWDGFVTTPSFIYNANLTNTIHKNWQLTTEFFGFINQNLPIHNLDLNVSYLFNKQAQIGFIAGAGLSAAAHTSYFAINGMYGFKTNRRNKKIK